MKTPLIGFIGQGFIGKNYADDFETRGYLVMRYDLNQYPENKNTIKDCDVVFIAVPTPTTLNGFNDSILQEVLGLVGKGKTAIIKSTIKIGTTKKMQALYPEIIIMHSPEFLTEKTATYDAQHPDRNIIGITDLTNLELKNKAQAIIDILPPAPYNLITSAKQAEIIKYANNCWFYFKVIFMNIIYDLEQKHQLDHQITKEALSHDPRIGSTHLDVVHQGGRGAGGRCFIKDFEAFIEMLNEANLNQQKMVCQHLRDLNLEYLKSSGKNLDLLKEIYGK